MDIHEQYMQAALQQARQAQHRDETPVGAVLVHNGKIIAHAHNLTQTLCDATAHAEMQIIAAAGNIIGSRYLEQCQLYVTLEPCPMCAAAMFWSQLGELIYGAGDPKRGYTLIPTPLLHPKTKVTAGILTQECSAIMSDFFRKKR